MKAKELQNYAWVNERVINGAPHQIYRSTIDPKDCVLVVINKGKVGKPAKVDKKLKHFWRELNGC